MRFIFSKFDILLYEGQKLYAYEILCNTKEKLKEYQPETNKGSS